MTEERYVPDDQGFVYDIEKMGYVSDIFELLNEFNSENQTYREALKELKEIGDYQAMRIQELQDMNSLIEDEIDKKIAVLTDAQIKSFQDEDEELFGKVKFSIQVLRELKEVILND